MSDEAIILSIIGTYFLVLLAFIIAHLVASWFLFKKMGINPWKAIIPFYNSYTLCEKIFGNGLYFLVGFAGIIPYVGYVILVLWSVVSAIRLAKSFGRGGGTVVGLIFVPTIFYFILAFGSAEFEQLPDYDITKPFE